MRTWTCVQVENNEAMLTHLHGIAEFLADFFQSFFEKSAVEAIATQKTVRENKEVQQHLQSHEDQWRNGEESTMRETGKKDNSSVSSCTRGDQLSPAEASSWNRGFSL